MKVKEIRDGTGSEGVSGDKVMDSMMIGEGGEFGENRVDAGQSDGAEDDGGDGNSEGTRDDGGEGNRMMELKMTAEMELRYEDSDRAGADGRDEKNVPEIIGRVVWVRSDQAGNAAEAGRTR